MVKKILMAMGAVFAITVSAQVSHEELTSVNGVVKRVFPEMVNRVVWKSIEKDGNHDVFEQSWDSGRLCIAASSPVSACRGVYDFIRNNEYGISSWTGNRLSLPEDFDSCTFRRVVSPFQHHYYFNVVTYGYTMPYWDWKRWEQEIDWMALHGIDMPLALVANEAILARTWKKMGLTDEEISEYFVGPAHLPWMRMGNISGIDGPLPLEWHQEQVALQHKILNRMHSLGMHPICPGFAGFVPKAMNRLYPDVKITETSWGGAFHNWMLSPQEELFLTIGKMFIEEWEKEFGKNDYYLVDSFNEMDIPFPPKGNPQRYALLASYGDRVYQSIKEGNPDAVWVMQGWMFGYQRDIWDEPTLSALLSKVPDDKMLLLDLAVDYNRCFWKSEANWDFYKGFHNKPWVYSVIPNMGGKSGMTGILDFYANGHLDALQSENRGNLVAHGMAPEGIENNEVIYELIADAGWSDTRIEVDDWLEKYCRSRYGVFNEGLARFWKGMVNSVYGSFTDHPRYNWQLRPGLARRGTIHLCSDFYEAIENLTEVAPSMAGNILFENDFREWAVAYAGGKAEELTVEIDKAFMEGDTAKAIVLEQKFVHLLTRMDEVLKNHPTKDMQRWIDFARNYGGDNRDLADYYEKNARRIVTIWGPPVDDYSARIWSGLIRDYYLPRWQYYFEQRHTGKKFDFAQWERYWVEQQRGLSQLSQHKSPFDLAIGLVGDLQSEASAPNRSDIIGTWDLPDGMGQKRVVEMVLPYDFLKTIKILAFTQTRKHAKVCIDIVELIADGKVYPLGGCPLLEDEAILPICIPEAIGANNECRLKFVFTNLQASAAAGMIKQLK